MARAVPPPAVTAATEAKRTTAVARDRRILKPGAQGIERILSV
jgi:hypothetical protein